MQETNPDEFRVFLALLQLQGIVVKPHFWHYWTKKPLMDTPFIRGCMSYKRFSDLKRFLRFSNNETFDPDGHPNPKLNKIYHVFDYNVYNGKKSHNGRKFDVE